MESELRYTREALVCFARQALAGVGVPEAAARLTADRLVSADERGVATHGLVRLSPYISRLQAGLVNATPSMDVLSERNGITLMNGDHGLGQVVASAATIRAIRAADEFGVGVVGVQNAHHIGMCGLYVEDIAAAGYVGVLLSNTAPLMAPTGSARRLLGNNPMAFSVPRAAPHPPIVLDIALSQASYGALQALAAREGAVPDGWVQAEDGSMMTDPVAAAQSGTLLPVGKHKGYGIALMVELLAGAMTGSSTLDEVGSLFRDPPSRMGVGNLILAMDPASLVGTDAFTAAVESVCRRILAAPPLPGVDEVQLPGDREHQARAESERHGVPLSREICEALAPITARYGVLFPDPLADSGGRGGP